MSSNFIVPPKLRRVLVTIYDHGSLGPRYHDIPDLQLQVRVCQTTTLKSLADFVANGSAEGHSWIVGRILDCHGDDFVDPAETVWGALELMPICIIKAAPLASLTKTRYNPLEERNLLSAWAAGSTVTHIPEQHLVPKTLMGCHQRYKRLTTCEDFGKGIEFKAAQPSAQVVPVTRDNSLPAAGRRINMTKSPHADSAIGTSEDEPLTLPEGEAISRHDAGYTGERDNGLSASVADGVKPPPVKEVGTISGSSPSLSKTGDHGHAHRRAMSLTPVKMRGKNHDETKGAASTPKSTAELNPSSQEELEYEASIDASLRRAKEEAERQGSATRLERAERFMMQLRSTGTDDQGEQAASPAETDSSPTVRHVESRSIRARRSISRPLRTGSAYRSEKDTSSSPSVVGRSEISKRRVHFSMDDDLLQDNMVGASPNHSSSSPAAETSMVDNVLDSSIPAARQADATRATTVHATTPSASVGSEALREWPQAEEAMRRLPQQVDEHARPMLGLQKHRRQRLSRSVSSSRTMDSRKYAEGRRHLINGLGDRVSEPYNSRKQATKKTCF